MPLRSSISRILASRSCLTWSHNMPFSRRRSSTWAWRPGQSGEARIFLIQDDNLTAEVPLRRSILQSTLRQKYRSTGRHNPQRDGGPEKGLYRLHPIALAWRRAISVSAPAAGGTDADEVDAADSGASAVTADGWVLDCLKASGSVSEVGAFPLCCSASVSKASLTSASACSIDDGPSGSPGVSVLVASSPNSATFTRPASIPISACSTSSSVTLPAAVLPLASPLAGALALRPRPRARP